MISGIHQPEAEPRCQPVPGYTEPPQVAAENCSGETVLNTFAYTGSLGVAAMAGGAAPRVQQDLNRQFLNLAKSSYTLNGFFHPWAGFHNGGFLHTDWKFKRAGCNI